ncbi:hypothetical protein Taro_029702 [Colocasia esculenta]|uniref:Uncharacterized protein n=1 Tax=Colocasia esculenta TaxID=4460 RepID=A0A843VEH2_COLES|nr:hypothetical protein [Colocasia esculenta]
MKNRSTSVDTRQGQVDTRCKSQRILFTGLFSQVDTKCRQVDTRWLSQKACFAVWDRVSTLDHLRASQKSRWRLEEFSSLFLPSWCFLKTNSHMFKHEKWKLIVEEAIGSPQGSKSSRSRLL